MLYVDTSIIVKLYIREKYSREASNWLKANNEAVPLTSFHELEFINAMHLKRFRREATPQIIVSADSLQALYGCLAQVEAGFVSGGNGDKDAGRRGSNEIGQGG